MMNYRLTFNFFAKLLLVLSGLMAALSGVALLHAAVGDARALRAEWALLSSAATGALIGGALWWATRRPPAPFGRREAMLLVAISWLGGAALAALPLWLWAEFWRLAPQYAAGVGHPLENPINCYFEAMSGLTTTGATVLSDITSVPMSLLIWRAMTQWLGGLGIVMLFVAILPSLGVGGKKMFQVETPGPRPEGLLPGIGQTARALWLIYVGLTVAEILALKLAGLHWAQAICHTFATLATGGFSTENASMGQFNAAAQIIVIVFMVAAGINFALYFQLLRGRIRSVLKDTELRVYLGCLLVGSVVVIACLYHSSAPIVSTTGRPIDNTLPHAIQHGLFATVSIQTTTGFCTADFNRWPFLAKAVLVVLMFLGASAGSTGGGLKVIRVWLMVKVMWTALERAFRPNVVRSIKVNGQTISPQMRLDVISYILGVLLLFGLGAVAYMLLEKNIDFTTAATASAATLFNVGPGLAKVGAIENYHWFSNAGKLVMSLFMAVGRLEVFAIVVLLSPRFWRGD